MEESKIPQIIFSSTAAVYAPVHTDNPVTEDALVDPSNVYGETKVMIEDMIKSYHRTGKIHNYTILRYFNVAGDAGLGYHEHNVQNVFPILHDALKNNTEFHIFGTDYTTRDGTCIRDYIHLRDLVNAHVLALSLSRSDTYNLGTGTGYTVRELIAMFEQVSGKKVNVVESPRRAGDVGVITACADKATRHLSWSPQHTLEEMVESTLGATDN